MDRNPLVISIANQKGGVGKTITVVNLGAGLALRGYRVLVMDFDIQANTTQILYRSLDEGEANMAEVLLEETSLDDLIRETNTPNLWLAPSGETMVRVDLALAGVLGREESLKRSLEDSQKIREMDFVIIDTSPYLGLLTVNALVASHRVLIPVSCEYLPMLGLKLFLSTIQTIQKRLNHQLEILGYLLSMYDRRERITFEVEQTLRNHFGELVFKHPIRVNTHHKASPAHKQTIFQYESASGRGIEDFNNLTSEVLERLQMPQER
jgi:chromosome partitioning protein